MNPAIFFGHHARAEGWPGRRPGTTMMLARMRHSVTMNAIQNAAAIDAVMMNRRGETSHEVSEMMRPKARPLNSLAICS